MSEQGETKAKKAKQVNYERIDDDHAVSRFIRKVIESRKERHAHLRDARLGVCWHLNQSEDVHGHRQHGKAMILSDWQREFIDLDIILFIDQQWWNQQPDGEHIETTDQMRFGLVNHLLTQVIARVDEAGNQKTDERGRTLWIKRKPDVALFKEEIREGAWNDAMRDVCEQVIEFRETLFEGLEPGAKTNRRKKDAPALSMAEAA